MPLPTRAAKRVLGSTGGTAGACGASRWAAEGNMSHVSSDWPPFVRLPPEWWPNRRGRLGAQLVAQRVQLVAQRGHLALEALEALG